MSCLEIAAEERIYVAGILMEATGKCKPLHLTQRRKRIPPYETRQGTYETPGPESQFMLQEDLCCCETIMLPKSEDEVDIVSLWVLEGT